ncbi:MAG: DUF4411 family protein [Candidatus Thorarchaeota archaeon]
MKYSFDTSAFINPWKHYYRPHSFPRIWELVDSLIQKGEIVASEMVLHELKVQKDDLLQWVVDREDNLIIRVDEEQQNIVIRIESDFPKFVNHQSPGRDYADPFVIALAIQHNLSVVTDETKPKKGTKIPDVCDFYNVGCIGYQEFLENIGYTDR